MPVPCMQINIPQRTPYFNHPKTPSLKKISAGVDKETKEKVGELERHLKQIRGADSLRSINFNDLFIHPGLKFSLLNSNLQIFEKYNRKSLSLALLKVYSVAMAHAKIMISC